MKYVLLSGGKKAKQTEISVEFIDKNMHDKVNL